VKIATFNVNNIQKRLRNLRAWMTSAAPDCLPAGAEMHRMRSFRLQSIEISDYHAVWKGQ